MRHVLSLVAVALAVAAIAPVAALADDPTAAIQADIAQLQSDVKTKHDTVMADAAALQKDAETLVGSDRASAREKIKADARKLSLDWHALLATCLADRAKLQSDFVAAVQAGVAPKDLRRLIHDANEQIRASNLEMRAAVKKAHAAVVALRQSFRDAGKTPPATTTPPATPPAAPPVTSP